MSASQYKVDENGDFIQDANGDFLLEGASEALPTDSRSLAGLDAQRYPDNAEASILYNNPEEQQNRVAQAQQEAVSSEPMMDQLGAGLGHFAYSMPGGKTLAQFAGLFPKGSSQDEEDLYAKNKTFLQGVGEALPDVATATLSGTAAVRAASKVPKVMAALEKAGTKIPQVRNIAEGLVSGAESAAQHQYQNFSSGKELSAGQVAGEIIPSVVLPFAAGVAGDKISGFAPGALTKAMRPGYSKFTKDNARAALNAGITKGDLEATQALEEATLNKEALEARKASYTPAPPRVKKDVQKVVGGTSPEITYSVTEPTPIPGGSTQMATVIDDPAYPVTEPSLSDFTSSSAGKLSRSNLGAARAKTIKTLSPSEQAAQDLEDKLNEEALQEAAGVKTVSRAPKVIPPTKGGEAYLDELSGKYAEDAPVLEREFNAKELRKAMDKMRSQRGFVSLPGFAKPAEMQGPVYQVLSRKADFNTQVLNPVKKELEAMSGKATKVGTDESFDEGRGALSYWQDQAAKRSTAEGPTSQMTVEDLLGLKKTMYQAIQDSYKPGGKALPPGYIAQTKALAKRIKDYIGEIAPEVAKASEEESNIVAYRKALSGEDLSGSGDAKSLKHFYDPKSMLNPANLTRTRGGANLMYDVGKLLSGKQTVGGNFISQMARTGSIKVDSLEAAYKGNK